MKYDTHVNIASLYHNFSQNYEWLKSVARLSDSNRFAGVKSLLEEIARNYDASTNQVTRDFQEREVLLTGFEAKRFNQAVDYLRTLDKDHLPIKKIRSMCKGPSYHFEEIPAIGNSEGRDIQFEFILGAFLKEKGFHIEGLDDIQIAYALNRIRYECKRPAGKKYVAKKFDCAVAQLERKIAKQEDEYGIVALSIEKMEEFDQKFFRGSDIYGVSDILIQHKEDILGDLKDSLSIPSGKKILGLYLCVSILGGTKLREPSSTCPNFIR